MSLSPVIAVRLAGLLAGLILVAVVAFGAWRVPPSPLAAGVEVDLRAVSSGEVGVTPAGAVFPRGELAAGGAPARGRVRLTNRTAEALAVAPRITGGEPALDGLVEVELRVAGRTAFRGPLGWLREQVAPVATLPRGGSAAVGVTLRVPASAGTDAAALAGSWTLTFAGSGEAR